MSLHELAKDKFGIPAKGSEMNLEFAERDAHQSGLRFVDSSVPRLMRHVSSCETASISCLPAGKDEKAVPECGQKPRCLGGRQRACLVHFAKVQIKRDTPRGVGSGTVPDFVLTPRQCHCALKSHRGAPLPGDSITQRIRGAIALTKRRIDHAVYTNPNRAL